MARPDIDVLSHQSQKEEPKQRRKLEKARQVSKVCSGTSKTVFSTTPGSLNPIIIERAQDINITSSTAEYHYHINAKRRDHVEFSPNRYFQRRKATRHHRQSRILSQRLCGIFEGATFYFNRSTKVRIILVTLRIISDLVLGVGFPPLCIYCCLAKRKLFGKFMQFFGLNNSRY